MDPIEFQVGNDYRAIINPNTGEWQLQEWMGDTKQWRDSVVGTVAEDDKHLKKMVSAARPGTPLMGLRASLALQRATAAYRVQTGQVQLTAVPPEA